MSITTFVSFFTLVGYAVGSIGCCDGPAATCAPVSRPNMVAFHATVEDSINRHGMLVRAQPLRHVGHKLGAYMEYPHHICTDGIAGGMTSQTVLMDRGFAADSGLDGLELDAQPAPSDVKSDPELYVVHDPIDPGADRWRYASLSLRNLLEHFRKNYSGKNKHLFIELKAQRKCNGKKLATDYDEQTIAERMMAILKDFPTILNDISLTSFNARALEAAHQLEPSKLGGATLRYYLIVGPSGFWKGKSVCWAGSGDVPRFDPDQGLLKEPWLTGVWFSTKAITNYGHELNKLNRARDLQHQLRFGISAYGDAWKDIEASFSSGDERLAGLEAVIYDVCDRSVCPDVVEDSGGCHHHRL